MGPFSGASGGNPAGRHASPEELAAYALDPSALDAALLEHLATCASCQTEAGWMQGVIQELEQAPRCPAVEALVSYALGDASPTEQQEIAAHLPGCAACREEVEVARATLQPAAGVSRDFLPIRRWVATIAQPLLTPERGSGAASVEAGVGATFKVTLDVDPDGAAYVISGTIEEPVIPAVGQRLALLYAAADPSLQETPALVAEGPVNERGEFDLEGVPAGSYRLDLLLGNQVMTLQPILAPWTIPPSA